MEEPRFPIVLRGYDRGRVDARLAELERKLAQLEQSQTREGIVQSALEEVGQQTAAILKQAHETSAEITASSRSQAEGRLERARREAEQLTADAEQRARRLEHDTEALWEERSRLIEEIRRLAEETLTVADDALERVPPPSQQGAEETAQIDPEPEASDATTEMAAPGNS